jgi:hypothetical protein
MTWVPVRRENHVGIADVARGQRHGHSSGTPRGIGQTRVDVKRYVRETHHEARVPEPPECGCDRKGPVNFFNQLAATFHGLLHLQYSTVPPLW